MTTEPNEFIDGNGDGTGAAKEPVGWRQWPLEDQVAHLAETLRQARQEAAQNLDAAQRAQAEMANFRRRTDEERIANAKFSNGRLIAKFLPSMEDLDPGHRPRQCRRPLDRRSKADSAEAERRAGI